MSFHIEVECPQCGFSLDLEETDHLVRCSACGVSSYLHAKEPWRFILPHRVESSRMIYAPYVRFRGSIFVCRGTRIEHVVADLTRSGSSLPHLPVSLGFRPQAMKMRFAAAGNGRFFVRNSLGVAEALTQVEAYRGVAGEEGFLHRAYIGETVSVIYLPLLVHEGQLVDAVVDNPLGPVSEEDVSGIKAGTDVENAVRVLGSLCPGCGWNLEGERDSVVLFCRNCDTAWEPGVNGFTLVGCTFVPSAGKGISFLPFWQITVSSSSPRIGSFADFIAVTNQPMVPREDWRDMPMNFLVPGFKIRPKNFLSLATAATISAYTLAEGAAEGIPGRMHAVTLPRSEAQQSLKVTLASATINRRELFPKLPGLSFSVSKASLLFLPFAKTQHDLVNEQTGIAVNRRVLKYGRAL